MYPTFFIQNLNENEIKVVSLHSQILMKFVNNTKCYRNGNN